MAEPVVRDVAVAADRASLTLTFDDGASFRISAELLRVESPSAEVRGHAPGERVWLGGKGGVKIVAIEPVGNYALKIRFDDGHDTGLYDWRFLRALADDLDGREAAYRAALAERGLRA